MRTALWRNRDFMLLQAGQLLSTTGTQATSIAYPLLVLAVSHSPAQAGLVAFVRLVPVGLFALPAGLAADRWPRRRVMIAADVARAGAITGLAAAVVLSRAPVWAILLVAFVEGTGATFFTGAQPGALRAVVPRAQLPAAAGAQEARRATVRLVGPPLGGALYGLHRAVPFVVDAASYAFSTVALLLMRTPFQEARERDASSLRFRVAEGFRFLWTQPFLRTTALIYIIGNFLGPAIFLLIVVIGRREGLSAGVIGLLSAGVGVGTLVGSLASPLFRRLLSVRAILLLEQWMWLGLWAFVAWPSVYVLTAAITLFGVTAPVTDSVVVGYRLAVTPDRLVGRVESVRTNISLLITPLGALAAGLLIESMSARATVAVLAALGVLLVLWGNLSPAIRNAPSLTELETVETT